MRAEKQLLLDEIREKIKGSKAVLVTRYAGLQANAANNFRRVVRDSQAEFEVVSKRLLLKATEGMGIDFGKLDLAGHIGIVVAKDDPIQTTKAVFNFSKENEEVVSVVGGQIGGVVYGATEVDRLSKLPGLNEMRAQILGLLEAPMAQTLAVMDALLTSVLHCLEGKQKIEQ